MLTTFSPAGRVLIVELIIVTGSQRKHNTMKKTDTFERKGIQYQLAEVKTSPKKGGKAKSYFTVDLESLYAVKESKNDKGEAVKVLDEEGSVKRVVEFMTLAGLTSYCQDMLDVRLRSVQYPVKDGKTLTLTEEEKLTRAVEYIRELELDTRNTATTPERCMAKLATQMAKLFKDGKIADAMLLAKDIEAIQEEMNKE